jgi:ATP-binding cassette subfamily B protein
MIASTTNPTATKLAVRHYMGQIWLLRRWSIPTLLVVSVGTVFTAYAPPLVIAAALKHFESQTPTLHALLPYLFGFGGLWLVGEMLWRVAFMLLQRFEARAMYNLYINALAMLSKKDLGFFHDNFAGSLTKKTISYGRSFESFFDTIMFNVTINVLPLIFVSIILWRFSPWLVVVLLGSITIALTIMLPLIKKRKHLVDLREAASNTMAGHVADVIGNMDAVQAFAHQAHEQKRHEQNVKDYMEKSLASWDYHTMKIDLKISPIYVLINVAGLAVAVLLGGESGGTMAAIFITFSYYAQVTRVLWEFNRTYRNLENAIAEAAQFTELLLAPTHVADPDEPQAFAVQRGAVSFQKVDFSYRNAQSSPLFRNFNLDIAPGEKIALVGHSGGGKTTVTKLLLRFEDVTRGQLLIDGQNVAHAKLAAVRRSIAYVPQEPMMFHRSIRENIRYGRLKATETEVINAAKRANAHEFITKLPHGYDTMVGERGVKLSGGQRQRIAIARAIIKDAPILVLDEATSALDSESEKLIQDALWKLMQDRTAIVIAHRLSTIQKMDRIIVLDEGLIAEQGTHHELLAHNGIYAKLWSHQSGGFIEE